jgi:hypothetical protein
MKVAFLLAVAFIASIQAKSDLRILRHFKGFIQGFEDWGSKITQAPDVILPTKYTNARPISLPWGVGGTLKATLCGNLTAKSGGTYYINVCAVIPLNNKNPQDTKGDFVFELWGANGKVPVLTNYVWDTPNGKISKKYKCVNAVFDQKAFPDGKAYTKIKAETENSAGSLSIEISHTKVGNSTGDYVAAVMANHLDPIYDQVMIPVVSNYGQAIDVNNFEFRFVKTEFCLNDLEKQDNIVGTFTSADGTSNFGSWVCAAENEAHCDQSGIYTWWLDYVKANNGYNVLQVSFDPANDNPKTWGQFVWAVLGYGGTSDGVNHVLFSATTK